jgi:hypothetical protein
MVMDIGSFLLLGALTVAVLGGGMLAMSIGVMFKRKCLRGSCGGEAVRDADGKAISCHDCPNRDRRRNAPAPSGQHPPAPQSTHADAHRQLVAIRPAGEGRTARALAFRRTSTQGD